MRTGAQLIGNGPKTTIKGEITGDEDDDAPALQVASGEDIAAELERFLREHNGSTED
jgi:hypothetical protein